jgi:hypothetical protein
MFAAITILSIVFGAYGVLLRRLEHRRIAIKRVEESGGFVSFGESIGRGGLLDKMRARIGNVLFSDRFAFYDVEELTFVSDPDVTNDELQIIREFPSVTQLSVHSSVVTEDGLKALKSLTLLRIVCLYKTSIQSDTGLDTILTLDHLRYLLVSQDTPISVRRELELFIGAKGRDGMGDNADLFVIDGRGSEP